MTRPWQIYVDLAQHLIGIARPLRASEPLAINWIPPCMPSMRRPSICVCRCFLGYRFALPRAAVRLHTLLDLRGNIPTFIHITDGKTHEVNRLDELSIEAGAFYLLDRGYLDL
jgi:hypothetical protein